MLFRAWIGKGKTRLTHIVSGTRAQPEAQEKAAGGHHHRGT